MYFYHLIIQFRIGLLVVSELSKLPEELIIKDLICELIHFNRLETTYFKEISLGRMEESIAALRIKNGISKDTV